MYEFMCAIYCNLENFCVKIFVGKSFAQKIFTTCKSFIRIQLLTTCVENI